MLKLSNFFTVTGPAADPSQYVIESLNGGKEVQVTGVGIAGKNLVLTTTTHSNGKLYEVTIPTLGIVDLNQNAFAGDFSPQFTGFSSPVAINMAKGIDARTIDIIFNVGATQSEAENVNNYNVVPPLTVLSATKITDLHYQLKTSKQQEDLAYTITVSNITEK